MKKRFLKLQERRIYKVCFCINYVKQLFIKKQLFKDMQQVNFENQIQKSKEWSTLPYDQFNKNKIESNLEHEGVELPPPQLMNMMSYLSDKFEEELESPINIKLQTENHQNQQEDVQIDKNIEGPIIQIQVQPSKPDDHFISTLEQRSRRIRKQNINANLQRNYEYNQESDLNSQSNEHTMNPCNCSKSNCLKLYCQCFHQNKQCTELCKCLDCKNCDYHTQVRQTALEKIKMKSQRQKHDNDLFDLSKVWGCKCQKSQCQKNYCECFRRNQKCNSSCRCKDCANKKKIPNQFKKKKKFETATN
ncbi:unnamed protein product (macronuclear) [Paramecium tetraurelia]|uniref:CRC domain-containing protein n=1 Tax=Paramecium tetraurelia TaxID=5888 RepID=A0EAQ3_PARTE|nr:uncharacterized protein GSPATT00025104001 [Paramecium tetraurelia]CAK92370.1 unnamed protein product [Paramecium tetraurelia]|eukprot:XP_001459767.1 hypothetical protein (macronuclear) [Paramecium tetraurelia strain d4-2]